MQGHDNPRQETLTELTPQRFHEIRALFEAALQMEPSQRSVWLRERCKSDSQICECVEKLLLADAAAGVTDAPILLAMESASAGFEGRRVGHYQVLAEIGRGGMGSVYLAERTDDVFSKRVALKVMRPERSCPGLHRRFRQERDIIARLDHPNIARLMDGGATEEGLPYSVMEYVQGQSITVYCDAHRLNITNRLKLFRTVCAAVQYAHQNLVVHRDLKPSNILVTSDGTVKLLDFGIAKLLEAGSQETFTDLGIGLEPMTPAYASPEQTRGEPINTSSDVYSLGIILYELLTGRLPYSLNGRLLHEIAKAVCEQEPLPPSEIVLQRVQENGPLERPPELTPDQRSEIREGRPVNLRRRLMGDLDNIVLMALRKEPQRRYRSVEQFSEDIGRHLTGLPVLAQKDTLTYRSRKFVKRHRGGVLAACLVAVLLIAAVVGTSWQAHIAWQERGRAERQTAEARFQSERAERHAKEAEAYRQRAEREAAFARDQLRIAEARTREAAVKELEATQERDKAATRAREINEISAALLRVTPDLPGAESGQQVLETTEKILVELLMSGYEDSMVTEDLRTARALLKKYGSRPSNLGFDAK
jgi:serine/threonine protein kinase